MKEPAGRPPVSPYSHSRTSTNLPAIAAAAAMAVALVPVVALDLGVAWLWGAFGVLMAVRRQQGKRA